MLKNKLIHSKTRNILLGLVLVCILAPLSISAGPVPITLQTFILFTITGILDKNSGTIVAVLYLICGALGLPVFSDFSSGFEKLSGPTAGFLWAFPFMCYLLGWLIERFRKSIGYFILHFMVVHIVLLVVGFGSMMIFVQSFSFSFSNLLSLLPGLIIKSVVGGRLAFWISNKLDLLRLQKPKLQKK